MAHCEKCNSILDDYEKGKCQACLDEEQLESECSDCGCDLSKEEREYGATMCFPCMKGNRD